MFFKKRTVKAEIPQDCVPVILSSICTGEKVIGFKNRNTGAIEQSVAVKTDKDVEDFCEKYGIKREDVRTVY